MVRQSVAFIGTASLISTTAKRAATSCPATLLLPPPPVLRAQVGSEEDVELSYAAAVVGDNSEAVIIAWSPVTLMADKESQE